MYILSLIHGILGLLHGLVTVVGAGFGGYVGVLVSQKINMRSRDKANHTMVLVGGVLIGGILGLGIAAFIWVAISSVIKLTIFAMILLGIAILVGRMSKHSSGTA